MSRLRTWLQSLHATHDPRPASQRTDGDLVSAFAESHDDAAFSELVRRHGPMVLATCRRLLHPDIHTADDAFQAAFLVLATKAGAVTPPERVGAWLHGVAVHVAKKARSWVRKIAPSAPSDLDKVPAHFTEPDPDAAQVRATIDDVLAGLPAKYRAPVILCELEGRSRADAARALGWTEGTLSGRLARARKLLADRLARRGVALPAAGLAVALLTQPATASVPAHLAASTVQAAMLVAAGAATAEVASGPVAALARAGCPTMITFKVLAAGVAGIGLTLGGFGVVNLLDKPTSAAPPLVSPVLVGLPIAAPVQAETKGWVAAQTITHKHPITSVAYGTDFVVVGDTGGVLAIYDAATGKEREKLLDGSGEAAKPINRVQLSSDAKWIYLVTNDGEAIHQVTVEKQDRIFPGTGGNSFRESLGVTGDGANWIVMAGKTVVLRENKLNLNMISGQNNARFVHPDDVTHAASEGSVTVTVAGSVLRGWEIDKEKPIWEAKLDANPVTGLSVSPDGKRVAVLAGAGPVWIFEAQTGKKLAKTDKLAAPVVQAAMSWEGKRLLAACEDKTARIYDTETGKELAVLKGHTQKVTCAVFSPNGEAILTGSADKTVKVWEFKK